MPERLRLRSTADIRTALAARVRERRRRLKLSRAALAERSGVPAATIKRFESSGEISLRQFVMLWHTVADLDDFDALLMERPSRPRSIDDIVPP